jgi:hypothetical protein
LPFDGAVVDLVGNRLGIPQGGSKVRDASEDHDHDARGHRHDGRTEQPPRGRPAHPQTPAPATREADGNDGTHDDCRQDEGQANSISSLGHERVVVAARRPVCSDGGDVVVVSTLSYRPGPLQD